MKLEKILWSNLYSVKVEEIDKQHKDLIGTVNKIIECLNSYPNQQQEQIESIFKEILNYTEEHFKTEEKYFSMFKYEGAKEHIEKHREFVEYIDNFKANFELNNTEKMVDLIYFLEQWLEDHLINMDHKYMKCFKANGLV